MTEKNLFASYLKTYSGRELLKKHSLSEEGVWHVFGEDPNCDLGGHHHEPDLGYIEGRLEYVIHAAVKMSGFWQWGSGGRIVKHEAPVVRKAKKVLRDNDELERLLKQRDEIDARIKALGGK